MRFAQVNDVASVSSELAQALRKRGHSCDVIYPKLVGAGLPPALKLAVAPWRFVDWLRLAWRIRRGRYDVVHIHYGYLGIVGIMARRPYVLHCHGDDVRDVGRRVWAPAIRLAIRWARHVYYSTPDLAEQLTAIRPDAEFLPNPIDTETFHVQPLRDDADDVLVACALSENKGLENLLHAFEVLRERRPQLRIDAVANGEGVPAANGMPNVLLLMHQPRTKLPVTMARHRVVVGQVHKGAVGMVELEGLACGRPVVCHFSYPEVYETPPPFVEAHSGEEIAAAVCRLLDDAAEAARIGAAGREWVTQNHDADRIAERIEALALKIR